MMNNAWEMAKVFTSKRMMVSLLMGFSGGLPILLTISVLQAWMVEAKVDLSTIGLFALVGLPYTLKFVWAPIFDRYAPSLLGRRRGWLVIAQLCLIASIVALAYSNPLENLWMTAVAALLLSFFSASQDIVIDAYRRESLTDDEQALGASLYVAGYRFGTMLASGGGLILADIMSFSSVYLVMAAIMLVGVATALWANEPKMMYQQPKSLREAVVNPFVDYFTRPYSILILLFILLYKVGDTVASTMTTPFYLQMGFSKTEIGSVVKLFGLWATIGGGIIGGLWILRLGIYRGLLIFGILQAVSTLGFAVLVYTGPSVAVLAAVITFENISGGLGTAAYLAFMASLTNKRYTATQYALLTSLMGVPRVILSASSGFMADYLGWVNFFVSCAIMALPGLILLVWLGQQQRWQKLGFQHG